MSVVKSRVSREILIWLQMLILILILMMVLKASRSDDHFVFKIQGNYQFDVTANDLEALISWENGGNKFSAL